MLRLELIFLQVNHYNHVRQIDVFIIQKKKPILLTPSKLVLLIFIEKPKHL